MRPVIGISGPDKGGGMAWFFTALSIIIAGGKPVRITPRRAYKIEKLNGVVIGGGADIDPRSYTEDDFIEHYMQLTLKARKLGILRRIGRFIGWLYYPIIFLLRKLFSRKSPPLSKKRDELEFNLINAAVKKNIPILGICRGAQLINIFFKGDLFDDINRFYFEEPNRHSIFPVKTIFLKRGSKIHRIFGIDKLEVNALHHQAVKKKGEDIEIVAREANQVVQGIEHLSRNFIIGVQWHPEYLIIHKRQRRIFTELVNSATEKSRDKLS